LRAVSYSRSVKLSYLERRSGRMVGLFGMMAEMGPWEHGGGPGGTWMLVPLLLWVVFFGLVAWGALRVFSVRQGAGRADSAEEVLRERFARGEVDVETYERSLDTLRRGSSQQGYDDYVREAEEQLRSDEQEPRP
jgi:putative membrane protein